MLFRSLLMKIRKRLARDIFDTLRHIWPFYDVTFTDCGAENSSTHSRVFETVKLYRLYTSLVPFPFKQVETGA